MRIGIDISQIVYGTGVSSYTKNLVENLLKIDKKNEYLLFAGSLRRKKDLEFRIRNFKGNFKTRFLPISPFLADLIWNRLHLLPMNRFIGSCSVFHSSDWTQPLVDAFRVTTIHDLSPIIFPKDTDPRVVSVHKRRLSWVKKEVDYIIAVSNSTKQDIIKYLGIPKEKIVVIYEAADNQYHPRKKTEVDAVKAKFKING